MEPATAMCSIADKPRLWPQRSCSKKMSVLASMGIQRLGHNTHVCDPGLLDGVHHRGEGTEGNIFVGADKNRLVLRITTLLSNLCRNVINVDGIVPEKYALLFVDGDHQSLFSDFLDGAGLRHADFNPGLQNGRGHHKDDQQHQHDVDQRSDIDIGESGLGASVGCGEGHYRLASGASRYEG